MHQLDYISIAFFSKKLSCENKKRTLMIGVGSLVVTSSKNIFELKSIHDNEMDFYLMMELLLIHSIEY
jgi:hypothetical protein